MIQTRGAECSIIPLIVNCTLHFWLLYIKTSTTLHFRGNQEFLPHYIHFVNVKFSIKKRYMFTKLVNEDQNCGSQDSVACAIYKKVIHEL